MSPLGISQLVVLLLGATVFAAGELTRRLVATRSQRMMCCYTIVGQGSRWARRHFPWTSTIAWTLMLGGVGICLLGLVGN